jgi:hypothetical protein
MGSPRRKDHLKRTDLQRMDVSQNGWVINGRLKTDECSIGHRDPHPPPSLKKRYIVNELAFGIPKTTFVWMLKASVNVTTGVLRQKKTC